MVIFLISLGKLVHVAFINKKKEKLMTQFNKWDVFELIWTVRENMIIASTCKML